MGRIESRDSSVSRRLHGYCGEEARRDPDARVEWIFLSRPLQEPPDEQGDHARGEEPETVPRCRAARCFSRGPPPRRTTTTSTSAPGATWPRWHAAAGLRDPSVRGFAKPIGFQSSQAAPAQNDETIALELFLPLRPPVIEPPAQPLEQAPTDGLLRVHERRPRPLNILARARRRERSRSRSIDPGTAAHRIAWTRRSRSRRAPARTQVKGHRADGPVAYDDRWPSMMTACTSLGCGAARAPAARTALSARGTMWLHLDHRAVHGARSSSAIPCFPEDAFARRR